MGRPKTWSNDIKLTIHPDRYRMGCVHNFVLKCMLGEDEVSQIIVKKGLMEKGYSGYDISDQETIFIAKDQSKEEKQIALLHEIFHVYFRDEEDLNEEDDEIIEERAELSAVNMLQWYKANKREYREFTILFKSLKEEKLTNKELRELF